MKKYPENKNYQFGTIGKEILKFWEENKIFEKTLEKNYDKDFIFYEGPPSANGAPGIHHVLSRSIKDIVCRYKTMKGFKVDRKAGWDTHGLPVELKVEKNLNITKQDIGKTITVEKYNEECKKTVMEFKEQWDDLTKKIGYWVDLEKPYITFDNDYIESVWYLLKKLFEKNLVYKGYNIQPYSPAAGTGLSSHELNMPGCYRNIKDISITAQFKIHDTEDEYFLAWTTTPWTLPANTALAINPKLRYLKIQTFNKYTFLPIKVILAEGTLKKYFEIKNEISEPHISYNEKEHKQNIPWKIIDKIEGRNLIGIKYNQLMPYIKPKGKSFEVIPANFVNTEDGTGIVHIAPTFGADDMKAAKENNIASIFVKDENDNNVPIVNMQGKFVDEIKDFAGKYVKEQYDTEENTSKVDYLSTDVLISIKLKKENKAFRVEKYEHNYPHCWRTDKPILYYPLSSWYINTTKYKEKLIEKNKEINWVPTSVGKGRFGDWLNNLVDWNLSRTRFWGIPLPIWKTEDEKETKCIGSIEQLKKEIQKAIEKGFLKNDPFQKKFDLHKPYIDEVILVSDNGQKMFREKEVIDVWFDSGSMPYAQRHFPFESEQDFEKYFPADFIAEGVDQTRGWFFTLHTIGVILFDSIAFKNVIVNGLVLDKDGNKMSKRLGNSIDPFHLINKYGSDIVRWYMIKSSNPWENLKFDEEELIKIQRKFFNTLENTYNFFATYANIDSFFYEKQINDSNTFNLDKWIISRINSLVKEVTSLFDNYDLTKAARKIENFVVSDLSNWYIRLNRKRFWKSENNAEKLIAYQTLYECLITISKISSPIAPFYMEYLFKNLNDSTNKESIKSVHLSDFPKENISLIDINLEKNMSRVQSMVSLVHSLRKQNKIKVRQPLSKILIAILNEKDKKFIENMKNIIMEETNVKKIQYIDNEKNLIRKKVKLNFSLLGKKYKEQIKLIKDKVENFTQEEIGILETAGSLEININSNKVLLKKEDVNIISEDIPGWSVISDGENTVALDITLNKNLINEGISREIINKIQNLRKDSKLDVQDKIKIYLNGEDSLLTPIKEYKEHICKETQALSFEIDKNYRENIIKINEDLINIKIEKV